MDKLKLSLISTLIYFSALTCAHAASCNDIVNQARLAIPTSPNSPTATLWNLTWLQSHLGQADTNTVVETHYQWSKGDLLARDNAVYKATNLPDAVSGLSSAQEVVNQMGPPQHIESTVLSQYRWVCRGNSTYLEVLIEKGKLVYADGQTCTADTTDSCTSFSGGIAPTQFETKLNSAKTEVLSTQLKNYNEHFQTTITNKNDLTTDMIARLKNYLGNLRQCNPGTYQYATPDGTDSVTFVKSVIKGSQDNFCMVETEQQAEKGSENVLPVAKCQYQQQNLALFADVEAENLIKGTVNPQIEKIQETQCRVFLNGQEIPMDTSSQ